MIGRLIGFGVVVVLLFAAIAVAAGGYAVLDRVLPNRLLAYMDQLGFTDKYPHPATGTGDLATDYLVDGPEGMDAQGPIAAIKGNDAAFTRDVISGYSTRISADVPAEITTIRPILGCKLTPPNAGSRVGHVTAGQSNMSSAMATYGDADLAAAVQTLVNTYRETGQLQPANSAEKSFQGYDVAVTETTAPVYLVLESTDVNRIWNIHLAPGAQIERVILLGGAQAGVANLDPVIPIEVMLTSGLRDCAIFPAYRLNRGNALFQSMEAGTLSQDDANQTLAKNDDAVSKYDSWFQSSFGQPAGASRIGWDKGGTISVVGPVPDAAGAKALWSPMLGAEVRATQNSFIEIRGQVAEGADFTSRVTAIATTFAAGDLTALRQGVEFR